MRFTSHFWLVYANYDTLFLHYSQDIAKRLTPNCSISIWSGEELTAASRASWYQLAIFESYFSNPNSKCLLGCAQTPFDLHRADAGRAFVPNTSITKKDSLGLSHNGRILGCHRLSGLCFFDGVLFFCKEQFYVTLRTKKFLHLVFRFTVIRVGCFLFRQQLGIFCI